MTNVYHIDYQMPVSFQASDFSDSVLLRFLPSVLGARLRMGVGQGKGIVVSIIPITIIIPISIIIIIFIILIIVLNSN